MPLSARRPGAPLAWYSSTNSLPDKFDAVIINCPRPPFSRYFAKGIGKAIGSGQKVSYVGKRSDRGSIPELDKFFTDKIIQFQDGSSAQELKRLPGAKVLAEENGKVWALRSGNLTIVSRTPDAGRGAEGRHRRVPALSLGNRSLISSKELDKFKSFLDFPPFLFFAQSSILFDCTGKEFDDEIEFGDTALERRCCGAAGTLRLRTDHLRHRAERGLPGSGRRLPQPA